MALRVVDRMRGSKWLSALPTGSRWNRALPGSLPDRHAVQTRRNKFANCLGNRA